ncbi:hypothetical protein GDO81_021727 [Engystomops pustulosus]|uniref:Uncharacterized protein n=1 Tax=Engystomops pustulosus TaxID=76066 RepID=A0AAV6Z5J9_ENGPU|nr:hypothetical protein GDO81_021727 [Engystomops pustulosus]
MTSNPWDHCLHTKNCKSVVCRKPVAAFTHYLKFVCCMAKRPAFKWKRNRSSFQSVEYATKNAMCEHGHRLHSHLVFAARNENIHGGGSYVSMKQLMGPQN